MVGACGEIRERSIRLLAERRKKERPRKRTKKRKKFVEE